MSEDIPHGLKRYTSLEKAGCPRVAENMRPALAGQSQTNASQMTAQERVDGRVCEERGPWGVHPDENLPVFARRARLAQVVKQARPTLGRRGRQDRAPVFVWRIHKRPARQSM